MAQARYYASSAFPTTLAAPLSASGNPSVNSITGLPTSYPFTVLIDWGLATQEAISVTSAPAGSGPWTLPCTRGIDGTTAQSHVSGAIAVHGVTAQDFNQWSSFIDSLTGTAASNFASAASVAAAASARAVTVTVGPAGSGASYICTGTHDGAQIAAAINSLPAAGGRVLIRNSATPYDFSASTDRIFTAASNIVIEGETYGGAVLKANASTFPGGSTALGKYGMLTVGASQTALESNVILRNLVFDCNSQLKTAAINLDGGSAMTGQIGLQNVWLEYVQVKNQCQSESEIESGMVISSGTDAALGNRGYVDKVTLWRCDLGPSNNCGMLVQGTNVTNFRWIECRIHDCQANGVMIYDYGTSATNSDWLVENCRFLNNMITAQSYGQAHFRDQTQIGVTNFVFKDNYVGPAANPALITQDYILTPYSAAGNRITGNTFDRCGNGLSLGLSHSGNQARTLPLNRLIISDNIFTSVRQCFDPDSSVFARISGNIFYGIKTGPVFAPYSNHWPTIIESNIFYDCNASDSSSQGSNNRSVLRLTGNGITVRNNHFIDDRLLPNPTEALALTQAAGGSLGSRTYYVRYTWANGSGETLARAEQSIALSAGNLMTINAAQTGPAASLPPGATQINYYVSSATGTETLQASVALPALSWAWTEPAAGLVSGTALPSSNTTTALTNYGIYETSGGGANSGFANVYQGNQFYGFPSGSEIVTSSAYTRVTGGNITNPSDSDTGSSVMSGGQDYLGLFGDGSDGAITFDGVTTYSAFSGFGGSTYTLTRDVFATSIVISSGVTIQHNNFRIYVAGILTNNGTILGSGYNATSSTGASVGVSGSFTGGTAGGAGNIASGSNGNPQTALGVGAGAAGGLGSSGHTGGSGGVLTQGFTTPWLFRNPVPFATATFRVAQTTYVIGGGTGGGGGGGDGTNAGGGGGSGGNISGIAAWSIVNNGAVTANGGGGFTPATGVAGGGGGGGGGLILTYTLAAPTGSGTWSAAGGTPGSGVGGGAAGTAGAAGTVLNVVLG